LGGIIMTQRSISRRQFLATAGTGLFIGRGAGAAPSAKELAADPERALIAFTLDLEMSRNFPTWETTHWDYEKGNLNAETKAYDVEAARRVQERGGRTDFVCLDSSAV